MNRTTAEVWEDFSQQLRQFIAKRVADELPKVFFENMGAGSAVGPTLLVKDPSNGQCGWVEAANLVEGTIKPNPLRSVCPPLSPDGRFALFHYHEKPWRVVELRSGKVTRLSITIDYCISILWSPDGKSIACRNGYSEFGEGDAFHIISFDNGNEQIVQVEGIRSTNVMGHDVVYGRRP